MNCVNYVAKKNTDEDEYGGFLCPRCARTNRVQFSVLEQYLDRYENDFDLRLSEAEVLKDLIRRAESWKENLKLVFESLRISSILLVWGEGKNSRSLLKLEGSLDVVDFEGIFLLMFYLLICQLAVAIVVALKKH